MSEKPRSSPDPAASPAEPGAEPRDGALAAPSGEVRPASAPRAAPLPPEVAPPGAPPPGSPPAPFLRAAAAAAAPPRRRPAPFSAAQAPRLGLVSRLIKAALYPVYLVLLPLSYFLRIRERIGLHWRVGLPLALLAAIGALWWAATRGDTYVRRFDALSPIEARKLDIQAVLGPVSLETRSKEVRDWTSGKKKLYVEIVGVELERASFDLRRAEVEGLFGAGQFEVAAVSKTSHVRLAAKSHFGRLEKESELERGLAGLRAAMPSARFEIERRREKDPQSGAPREVAILRRIEVPRAELDSGGRTALDEVAGARDYVVADAPSPATGMAVVLGTEKIEERLVGPSLVPSPAEMVGALPWLLNQRWSSWEDAKNWWKAGSGAEKGAPPPKPLSLKGVSVNEVLQTVADWALTRLMGPDWKEWVLLHAVLWSTIRIFMGFFWAALVAVPLGVIMGSFSKPRALFEPVRLIGSYLPLPAFLSLTIIWWGMEESQKIGFLAVASFVVLLPQVVIAVESVPQTYIDTARTLGATSAQIVRRVLLGVAKADIMRSLRLSFAVGWTWIILAEMINPKAGLGYVIQLGERRPSNRPHIYAAIIVIIALAFFVNAVWGWIEKKLYPYREAP